jgi:hypothetical protein
VNQNAGAGYIIEPFVGPHMIKVAMGIDDVFDRQLITGQGGQNSVCIVTGVDDHGFAGFFATKDKTVCLNGAQGHLVDNQGDPPVKKWGCFSP